MKMNDLYKRIDAAAEGGLSAGQAGGEVRHARRTAPRLGEYEFEWDAARKRKWLKTPPCSHRGKVTESREQGCCGGEVRVTRLFECSHEVGGPVASDTVCRICKFANPEGETA